ncbi:hypothetical protein [Kitasatospora sp. NPDC004272]
MHDVDAQLMGAARVLVSDLPATAVWTMQPEGHPEAVLFTSPDPVEDTRRRAHQHARDVFDRIEETDLLLALPHGIPIPLNRLTRAQQRRARFLSPCAVHIDTQAGTATRLAVRPATVHLALVEGPLTSTTLGNASMYAPFCTRAVLAPHPPRNPELLTEADFYGIGVALETDTGPQVLVRPTPWVRRRHSPAGWAFEESAYLAATLVPKEA